MSLGNVGSIGGEGSRGVVGINATKLAEDALDPSQYHKTSRGTVIPHRQSDMGKLPGLDVDAGLSQFKVVDIVDDSDVDEDLGMQVAKIHKPGELDALGKPKEEEDACPPTNQTSETSESNPSETASTSSPSPNPRSQPKTAHQRSSTTPALNPKGKTQKALLSELCERVNELSNRLPTEAQISSSVEPLLSDLLTRLDSHMSSMAETETSKTPPETSPHQTPWQIEMRGDFGVFKSEAAAVDLRRPGTVVMLFDPEKPHLVPARSEEPIELTIKRGEHDFDLLALANGWSSPLLVGEVDYLLLVMDLAE